MKYTVRNPILTGFHPDPCMIYVDGTYYIATSTFEYYPGVKISASEDLANWRTAAYPLRDLSLLDMRGDAAPASAEFCCVYVSYDEENECRALLKITYDDSRFRLERIASLPSEGAVWIRLCVDHADGRFLYSTDGKTFLPAGDAFDASKLSDEYNRPLGFTGPYVGIGCQDFSDWQKTADFKYFRYTEKTTE